MPEMPEVETMVSRLQKYTGMTVSTVMPAEGSEGERYGEADFCPNEKLNGVYRRGKYMIFMLDTCAILAHNAMSGYWDELDDPWTFDYVEGARRSKETDIRALIEIEDEGKAHIIQFHDARKFGSLKVLTPEDLAEKLSKVGPEVLESRHLYEPSAIIDEGSFCELFEKSKKAVKELLMDQGKMAGLGNIYAAEACWAARIDPFRIANTLDEAEASRLYHSSRTVLKQALDRRLDYGSLMVYRRKKCPSLGCKDVAIQSKKLKGRTTYWCPSCQK